LASCSDLSAAGDGAGYGVLHDGEGPARPPRPAPTQRRLLAAADRPIQYVRLPHPVTGRFLLGSPFGLPIGSAAVAWCGTLTSGGVLKVSR
jgi:hypothetical protein